MADKSDSTVLKDTQKDEKDDYTQRRASKPFTMKVELDIMQITLFVLALGTRTWQIGIPRAVVFDELHFAKFVSLYLKKIFFFDVHPPLGKLLLAFGGSYAGFQGDLGFDRIGAEYPSSFPVQQLRLIPAVCGSLIVPLMYQISIELGLTRWAALLAGTFILLDNALLVQSRFMLMEGMLLFFMSLSLMSFLKFRNLAHREFSLQWFFWLILTCLSIACSLSVKYIGFFTCVLIVYLAFRDYWKMLGDVSLSDVCLLKHLVVRLFLLIGVPVCIYIYLFYIHLSLLTKAGPHDNVMTSAFQASLEGGLAALTKGQPLYVAFGSQITLRHTFDPKPGQPCWLHSHAHVYPVKYKDGRGSSHQQQVTCYVYKDVHNWWIIKHPDREEMTVEEPPVAVKHNDIVQLVHGMTSRALNSHDVAAPVSPQCQEVSCYINYNVSMLAQNLWRVEILNRDAEDSRWETIKSHIRLVHTETGQALKITGKQLPEWGFNQLEVATDKIIRQDATVWNVEEHRYTKNVDKDGKIPDLSSAELIPLQPTYMSFWKKFWELQMKMLFINHDKEMEHKYSSAPLEWPFMTKNVAYWMSHTSNAQIHLLGNLVVWLSGTLCLLLYCACFVFYLLRRRRDIYDLTEGEWDHFLRTGEVVVFGYLLHFIPHLLTDSTLFLHHYLPCLIFKVLAVAAMFDHLERWLASKGYGKIIDYVIVGMIANACWMFYHLFPVTFGNEPLTPDSIHKLTWQESWEFLLHQP